MEADENRSKSYRDRRMENNYNHSNPSGMQDLRCYSASYASSSTHQPQQMEIVVAADGGENWKFNKAKSTNNWRTKSLYDPELQRKKRVASYKVYSVQAKIKGSFSNTFRWVKDKYSKVIHGYR